MNNVNLSMLYSHHYTTVTCIYLLFFLSGNHKMINVNVFFLFLNQGVILNIRKKKKNCIVQWG